MDAQIQATFDTLLKSMGFPNPSLLTPYIGYIKTVAPKNERLEPWTKLFVIVVTYFQNKDAKIETCVESLSLISNHFYFDTVLKLPTNKPTVRRDQVTDIVLRMLGIWATMEHYFARSSVSFGHIQQVLESKDGKTVSGLVKTSQLLPHPQESDETVVAPDPKMAMRDKALLVHSSLASIESLSINPRRLNAFRLSAYARTNIRWTTNISRHLLLSRHAGHYYLELFALPCTLENRSKEGKERVGFSSKLLYEIKDSYASLFNPTSQSTPHMVLLQWLGARWWCWCLRCSSRRFLAREVEALKSQIGETVFDPTFEVMANKDGIMWSQSRFQNLWPRIVVLDAHMQRVRPWGFWVLFRDRRDTLQFWTFAFGTIILFLTGVQVALGIAQVVGSF